MNERSYAMDGSYFAAIGRCYAVNVSSYDAIGCCYAMIRSSFVVVGRFDEEGREDRAVGGAAKVYAGASSM